jgi:methylenetetrahydrofolate dehydrogenase (NADP+) / methenyltetrahydrofolate cyclohydrolase
MAQILSGIPVREKIKLELIERINKLVKKPTLAIIQVGDREDSNIYIKHKIKFGGEIGAEVRLQKYPMEISEADLEKAIQKLNEDESVDGLIVQMPLPENVDEEKILSLVKKEKDPEPATASAVMEILDFYNIEVGDKKAAVIGQGLIAGKPIAIELEVRKAHVVRCDISTSDIPLKAKECDILVSAVGHRGLITKDHVNSEQVVVDVGGDVNFQEVEPLVHAITPTPGGVGPVTVACLFKNLVLLASR